MLVWAAALFLLARPALACQVERQASVPVQRVGGLLLVPVAVNGQTADFILDTGAERTAVGEAAAKTLHIARDEWVSTDIRGAGGRDRQRLGRPDTLSLGGIVLRRRTVAADHSVVIGPLPDSVDGHTIAGLLGEDYLSNFDLELNPASGTATLWSVSGCSGRFVPWTGPYAAIGAWRPVRNILAVPLHLGTAGVMAELDTGAQTTVVTLPGMALLGLAAGGGDTIRGFGKATLAARTQAFPAVAVGTVPPVPMQLTIAPIHTLRSIGALLGADWLGVRHIWISWATTQLFVAGPG